MFQFLQEIDSSWLVAINGAHCDYMDAFMWMVSKSYSWLLIGLVAVVVNARRGWRNALVFLFAVALAVLVADQVASGIIKHAVERLRPTHEPALKGVLHIVRDYRGGLYGFVSSHAANSFAIALLVGGMMPHCAALGSLMAWAVVQCYSRMYLGVHYPGDIVGGIVVGLLAGAFVFVLWRKACARYCPAEVAALSTRDALSVAAAVWVTVLALAIVAFVIY